jgi:pimeloyl-ACP methyl ester carboxylesterase
MRVIFFSITRIILALIVCGILASVLLYFIQDKMIFYPQKIDQRDLEAIKIYKNVKEISLETGDGVEIKGWFIDNRLTNKSKILLYFGGNAEEVSYIITKALLFKDCSVVLFNYRGYGQSQGSPKEQNLYSDATAIYDKFVDQHNSDSLKIIVMGRSIGTGVAVYLAKSRKTDGVILVSPYQDLKTLAQVQFPFLPARLIVKYKFNSAERAPFIKAPLLAIIGTEDKTIPSNQSKLLIEKWGGKVILKEFIGADHNNLSNFGDYWKSINDFINTI